MANLASTLNFDLSVPYREALTKAQPDDKWLWFRLPDTIKNCLTKEKLDELNKKMHDALEIFQNWCESWSQNCKNLVKEIFVELWMSLETGFSKNQIIRVVDNLDSFTSALIVPIQKLSNNTYLYNESCWPTDAFKDLALQMLTEMSAIIVEEQNKESIKKAKEWERWQKLKFLVNLTSTSWDTWPAGWSWIEWKKFILNVIWFPVNEATFSQQWQMIRLWDNVLSLPMNQEFSDIQEAMKNWNTPKYQAKIKEIIEREFADLIEEYGFEIEVDSWSFNSINPWRIDGQTIYHEYWLIQAEAIWIKKKWEKFIEVCPSWNGWHMFSILQAINMHWCVDTTTVVTCNENDMFYKIFEEWRFTKIPDWTETIHQASVSMIIKFPNNMERLFAYAFWDKRAKEIHDTFFGWQEVVFSDEERKILKEKLKIHCYRVTCEDELKTIWTTFNETWRLVCPHTANAITWLQRYREEFKDNETPALVSETASPWKFLAATAAALECTIHPEKNIIKMYNFYRQLEKTKIWCNEIIMIIRNISNRIQKPINESMIPADLWKIYQEWFKMPEVIDASEFHDETLKFLEKYASEFKKQIMELIEE